MMQIELTQNKISLIDDEDYELVDKYQWHAFKAHNVWYARASKGIYLHRLVVNASKEFEVDHRDGNGLNNQKSNLIVCTHAQNLSNQRLSSANTTGFKGVSQFKKGWWTAQTKYKGKRIYIGDYRTALEAALAYDRIVVEFYGDFAMTNERLGLLPDEPSVLQAKFDRINSERKFLVEQAMIEIRGTRKDISDQKIADKYGVSRTTISNIRRGNVKFSQALDRSLRDAHSH